MYIWTWQFLCFLGKGSNQSEDDSKMGDFSQAQAESKDYDVIMVDAYQDITIPFQMSSVEFFTLVKKQLNPEGVMVVNMNMKSDGEDGINEYLSDTISSVFPNVYTVDVSNNTNRELFASESDKMIDNFKTGYQKETDGMRQGTEYSRTIRLPLSY